MTKRIPEPTAPPRERAFLVGAEIYASKNLLTLEESLAELALLADTAGLDIVGELTQKMDRPHPQTYIGSGKVEELKSLCEETLATLVIFDNELNPRHQRELEELRRQRHQAAMSALSSPLVIRKVKDEAKTGLLGESNALTPEKEPANHLDRLERLAGAPREGDYNPAADKDKEAFFDRAKKTDKQWISPNTRMAGQRYEVKTGAVIPAVMIGGINSDLPGQIIAQVSQNVFDTANGRFLLVPQGARLYGVYDSRIIYGQARVLVAWNRIIFPDGSAITLESMPGTDSAGYSGFNDEVNNHYFRTFGGALLMSLITGTTSWAVDSMTPTSNSSNSTNSSSTPTLQQEMASALATQFGQTTSKLLEKNMNIKPTLEIRPGYRFNVIVTKDLVFKESYREQ